MKIAINCAFFLPRGGGIAEYIRNLVSNIEMIDTENEYVLYVLKGMEQYTKDNLTNKFRIKALPYAATYWGKICRSLFEQTFWNGEEKAESFDIFHSPFFHSPHFKKAKVIITVHDLRFYRYPYTYTLPRYLFLKYKVRKSVKTADYIIAISEFTKRELIDAYKLDDDKITVIHEAIAPERYSNKGPEHVALPPILKSLRGRFVLSVGHVEPRKNYERLIEAFVKMKRENHELHDLNLVIVGKKGHHYNKVMKMIDDTSDVVYTNFVSHEVLLWLYKTTSLFVFPSFYEGFGFPPLEAGCMGTVSAVSNVSSMPEVCGEAVAYFNPFDTGEMADVMAKCLKDNSYREHLKENLKGLLSKYSWHDNARNTLDLYYKLLNE